MGDWQDGQISIGPGTLYYERTGSRGAPPIVLAHGYSDDARCWVAVAAWLARRLDVVRYDARGHGRSSAPERGGPEEQARDLITLVTRLALDPPIVLGHSMGATTALVAAAREPARFRALVLEDPPLFDTVDPVAADERGRWVAHERAIIEANRTRTLDQIVADGRGQHPGWAAEEWHPWAGSKRVVDPRAADYFAHPFPNWRALLSGIMCPILLITGDPDLGALVTPEVALEAERLAPELLAIQIPGAGHSIRRDQPESYLQALERFLEVV